MKAFWLLLLASPLAAQTATVTTVTRSGDSTTAGGRITVPSGAGSRVRWQLCVQTDTLGPWTCSATALGAWVPGTPPPPPPPPPPPTGNAVLDTIPVVTPANHALLPRMVRVWLPPGYFASGATTRYPVLYAQDGDMMFEGDQQHGVQADTAALGNITRGQARPFILVAVHATVNRTAEYTPSAAVPLDTAYVNFLVSELKPLIDTRYRTLPDAPNTGIMGWSGGGIVAWKAVVDTRVFGLLGAISAVNTYPQPILAALPSKWPDRVYFSRGDAEGTSGINFTRDTLMMQTLESKGFVRGTDYEYELIVRGGHTVGHFARRISPLMRLLFKP